MFDPESYTISIRKEEHYGEKLYVGKVAEFPNISAFEDSYDEARLIILDAIRTLKAIADKEGATLPQPIPNEDEVFSGRISVRLPKSLHATVAKKAEKEGVSLNTYLVYAISSYSGEEDGIEKTVSRAVSLFGNHVSKQFLACASGFSGGSNSVRLSTGTGYSGIPILAPAISNETIYAS